LHFSIVKECILVGVQEVKRCFQGYWNPVVHKEQFLPINQYMKNEINLFPCELLCLSNTCFIQCCSPFQYFSSLAIWKCDPWDQTHTLYKMGREYCQSLIHRPATTLIESPSEL
jgi:hypothetical protein